MRYRLSNKVLKDLGMYFIQGNVEKWFETAEYRPVRSVV
ncbi:hypothetical protein MMALV_12610 [Candidatus Methanomethylophilus alvi Mx1201]|uniref:Uncharacterized protein n=1 Tax=Methanomethylophilus alvi (strain Mx1201) TaxID=1236689 RepID=M9SKK2_METAX|nr:hypothetical protein MMALV_12610 [Candidatus Methanomethylophilus alvi Mx1201]